MIRLVVIYIFRYPGAFYRTALSGFKKPMEYYLSHGNQYSLMIVGAAFTGLIIVFLKYIIEYFTIR